MDGDLLCDAPQADAFSEPVAGTPLRGVFPRFRGRAGPHQLLSGEAKESGCGGEDGPREAQGRAVPGSLKASAEKFRAMTERVQIGLFGGNLLEMTRSCIDPAKWWTISRKNATLSQYCSSLHAAEIRRPVPIKSPSRIFSH